MGSKGLKYVAVDAEKLPVRRPADMKAFSGLCKNYSKEFRDSPKAKVFEFGTSSVVPVANMLNTFPYKNRVEGQSPDAPTLTGTGIVESFEERGGGTLDRGHAEISQQPDDRRLGSPQAAGQEGERSHEGSRGIDEHGFEGGDGEAEPATHQPHAQALREPRHHRQDARLHQLQHQGGTAYSVSEDRLD